MCDLRYLCNIDKDGCVGYVYSIDGVTSGAKAYDCLLQVSRSRIILPELFLAVDTETNSAEYLFTPGGRGVIYPKGDLNRDYKTFTLCGRYDYRPVCLSFHIFQEENDRPLNVLVVLTPGRSEEMAHALARGLAGVA